MYKKNIPVSKRVLDISVILLSLPITIPIFLAIAVYIKLVSRGPIFFKQKRLGIGGTVFDILKFRTMEVGSETVVHESYVSELAEGNQKMKKLDSVDSRIIPGGRFIRAAGLDELPQLINVIKGEMSMVGPRPCTIQEERLFYDRTRFQTLPGLTGLWQVSGKNDTTFDEMIELDSIYVNNRNLLSDVSIMIETPKVLINQITRSSEIPIIPIKQFDTEFINR